MEIKEGEEYQIVMYPDKKVLYSGIAESDTEAEDNLNNYAIMYNANKGFNVPYPTTIKLEKL